MLTSLENGLGLDIVIWLQDHSNGLFDGLAELLNVVGGSMFVLIVVPLIYWSLHKRLSQHMIMLLLIGVVVSSVGKQLFDTPRPYLAHPDQVEVLFEAKGGGLPSGHVINALMFWFPVVAMLAQRTGQRRWWWLWGGYVLLMAWSRMVAGVHYPQDVIGGVLIGGLMLWLYSRYPLEPEALATPGMLAALTLLSALLILVLWSYDDGLAGVGAFLGIIWGLWIDRRFLHVTIDGSRKQRALRYVVGIGVMLALFFGMRALFDSAEPAALLRVLRYGLTTLFAIAGWPWAGSKIGL